MSELNIKPIIEWFEQAKPEPEIKDQLTQIGCHFEEAAEMCAPLNERKLKGELFAMSYNYKSNFADAYRLENLNKADEIEFLDSLADQIVTAVGVAYMMGFDIQGALNEVNRSNWSKFVDGKPILNEQGKIAKPDTYSKPELEGFIKCK